MQPSSAERRKNRIPLSPEELYYFIQLKKLRKTQELQAFKKTTYYKNLNRVNVFFVFILSYIVLSAFFLCHWEKTHVQSLYTSYEPVRPGVEKRSISDVHLQTVDGLDLSLKTENLFSVPQKDEAVWIGRDFLFGKILKARLFYEGEDYFHIGVYPLFFVCLFVMFIVCFIYNFNMHLTRHGLVGVTSLLGLAFIYVVCV
ncbi:MAG: hypothetical protein JST26_14085 [Bacteroidetes bacterium]|nr:hypothetical protein [Bacteroidota bacterium]